MYLYAKEFEEMMSYFVDNKPTEVDEPKKEVENGNDIN